MLDRSIASYKKLKSFYIEAEEEIRGGPKPRYVSFVLSVQWPWRAKLDLYSKTDSGPLDGLQLQTQRLVGASSYIEWNAGEVEPKTVEIKSAAARRDILMTMFKPDPLLVFGLLSLISGANPAKQTGVRQVLVSREKGIFGPLMKVRVVRFLADNTRPLTLNYFCSVKTGFLEQFTLSRTVNKKVYAATFDFVIQSNNDFGDQAGNDRYLYGWDDLPNDVDRGQKPAKR